MKGYILHETFVELCLSDRFNWLKSKSLKCSRFTFGENIFNQTSSSSFYYAQWTLGITTWIVF
jgi:hypothetical protein